MVVVRRCARERERLKETGKRWSHWWEWRNEKWRDRANTDGGIAAGVPEELCLVGAILLACFMSLER